ncbi:cupredoxin domain-containing protein [Aquimarina agarilytica]|uniref:cupredoxin domain-containing protein n=1 Tax=Aquimarina agarilytica TaxID=1087449 RepID=UPI000288B4D3|nr:cupredoxin domain-containing protein [Aquimarina agarilytica]
MKKLISLVTLFFAFTLAAFAQDVKTVTLEQTKGDFTVKELKLSEGTYVFDIVNKGVDHEVGFVLIEAGKDASNAENHIKNAYVQKTVKEGETQSSKQVELKKGKYTYFCPLNPTPQYTIIVE